jgi:VanZ family protein
VIYSAVVVRPIDRVARVLVLVAWMALITYWSDQGTLPIDQPAVHNVMRGLQHKLAHLVAFGLLALLARWAFDGLPRRNLLAIALVAVFGAFDEWHQSFVSGRRSALDDWALDVLSAGLAIYAWFAVRRWRHASASPPLIAAGASDGAPNTRNASSDRGTRASSGAPASTSR